MRIAIGVTGASGAAIAKRLLENLQDHETHLVMSANAERVIMHELGNPDDVRAFATFCYEEKDLEARLSSSSFILDSMIIVPCSMKTLASIANGFSNNLITRCAENMLKCNRTLILVPRETPLSLPDIDNMRKVRMAGAIVMPPSVAYYHEPKSVDDITDFFVGKILDLLYIDHNLYKRWKSGEEEGNGQETPEDTEEEEDE